MGLTRRQLLKLGGLTPVLLLGRAGPDTVPLASAAEPSNVKVVRETLTICPWDASGCGFIVRTDAEGKIISIEGDPDHPVNRGAACAKGASLPQIHDNERRLRHVMYRPPGGEQWEEKSWDWSLTEIAKRIKTTRDASWLEADEAGTPVRRTEAIASIGGSALDNEECYLLAKAMRSMGLVFLEHHARL